MLLSTRERAAVRICQLEAVPHQPDLQHEVAILAAPVTVKVVEAEVASEADEAVEIEVEEEVWERVEAASRTELKVTPNQPKPNHSQPKNRLREEQLTIPKQKLR